MTSFGFTLKYNKSVSIEQHYNELAEYLSLISVQRIPVVYRSYELDSRRKPHIHGIVIIPKNYWRKKLCFGPSFHFNLRELKTELDTQRWKEYCDKDQDILQEVPTEEVLNPPKYSLFKEYRTNAPTKVIQDGKISKESLFKKKTQKKSF